jgi:hypothetical protein
MLVAGQGCDLTGVFILFYPIIARIMSLPRRVSLLRRFLERAIYKKMTAVLALAARQKP